MTLRSFKRLTPGRQISAKSMNSALMGVEEMERATTGAGLALHKSPAGLVFQLPQLEPWLRIRITGGGTEGKYSWQQQIFVDDAWTDDSDGLSGDEDAFPAFESAGSEDVPEDASVWARINPDGESVVFDSRTNLDGAVTINDRLTLNGVLEQDISTDNTSTTTPGITQRVDSTGTAAAGLGLYNGVEIETSTNNTFVVASQQTSTLTQVTPSLTIGQFVQYVDFHGTLQTAYQITGANQGPTVALNPNGGVVTVGGGTGASELRFLEPSGSGSNYVSFQAPALATNNPYLLPSSYPAVSGYGLTSTTAGVMSWAPLSAGSMAIGDPVTGGTNKYVLYIDASGNLAQNAGMQFDSAGPTLAFTGSGSTINVDAAALIRAAGFQVGASVGATGTQLDGSTVAGGIITAIGAALTSGSNVVQKSNGSGGLTGSAIQDDGSKIDISEKTTVAANGFTVIFCTASFAVLVQAGECTVGGSSGNTFRWANSTSAPSTNSGTPTTRYGGDTNYCGDPDAWVLVNINGTDYKLPAFL